VWRNLNPYIQHNSTCDYTLQPRDWSQCPVTVIKNFISDQQVLDYKAIVADNLRHAICNFAYNNGGNPIYNANFRQSADLNSSFFPAELWDSIEQKMLTTAIEKYRAPYTKDQKALRGGHSFATIYRKSAARLGFHCDAGSMDAQGRWVRSVTTRYEMSALVYLSTKDVDFRGGALRFRYIGDQDGKEFVYHPVAGDLVLFPSQPMFAHGVDDSQGDRIVLGSWRNWRELKSPN
jgi:hypothetical protein